MFYENINQSIAIGIQKVGLRGITWLVRFGTVGTHRSRINHRFASDTGWTIDKC